MELIGYVTASMDKWSGRVDDLHEFESFRWHQHVKPLDLSSVAFNDLAVGSLTGSYVIIGYKVDAGITRNKGRAGARKAPSLIRKNLSNKPCSFTKDISIYDGGDVVCINDDVESSQQTLSILVELCLEKGLFPIVIGGGHDVAYGSATGVHNYFDREVEIGLINFDAHFDNRPYGQSTSGTMFRQLYDDFMLDQRNFNHLTIGIQKSSNTVSLFNYANTAGSEYILARDIIPKNNFFNNEVIKNFVKKNKYLYVTICCDVFSTSAAPGVSSPQPLGINPNDFMEMFKLILSSKKVVAFDIAEVSPEFDLSQSTVSLASIIIYTLVTYQQELLTPDIY